MKNDLRSQVFFLEVTLLKQLQKRSGVKSMVGSVLYFVFRIIELDLDVTVILMNISFFCRLNLVLVTNRGLDSKLQLV